MHSIRAAEDRDIQSIVAIHREMFPGFLMTLMGPRFLAGYYQAVLDSRVGLLFVAQDKNGKIAGFVSGFTSPADFYDFFRKRKLHLAIASLGYVVLRPALWPRILENFSTVNRVADAGEDIAKNTAELSSIAVVSNIEGKGCGKMLVERFVAECSQAGISSVVLTTDAENNDRVNRFYQKIGFSKISTFERSQGRLMNAYRMMI